MKKMALALGLLATSCGTPAYAAGAEAFKFQIQWACPIEANGGAGFSLDSTKMPGGAEQAGKVLSLTTALVTGRITPEAYLENLADVVPPTDVAEAENAMAQCYGHSA